MIKWSWWVRILVQHTHIQLSLDFVDSIEPIRSTRFKKHINNSITFLFRKYVIHIFRIDMLTEMKNRQKITYFFSFSSIDKRFSNTAISIYRTVHWTQKKNCFTTKRQNLSNVSKRTLICGKKNESGCSKRERLVTLASIEPHTECASRASRTLAGRLDAHGPLIRRIDSVVLDETFLRKAAREWIFILVFLSMEVRAGGSFSEDKALVHKTNGEIIRVRVLTASWIRWEPVCPTRLDGWHSVNRMVSACVRSC